MTKATRDFRPVQKHRLNYPTNFDHFPDLLGAAEAVRQEQRVPPAFHAIQRLTNFPARLPFQAKQGRMKISRSSPSAEDGGADDEEEEEEGEREGGCEERTQRRRRRRRRRRGERLRKRRMPHTVAGSRQGESSSVPDEALMTLLHYLDDGRPQPLAEVAPHHALPSPATSGGDSGYDQGGSGGTGTWNAGRQQQAEHQRRQYDQFACQGDDYYSNHRPHLSSARPTSHARECAAGPTAVAAHNVDVVVAGADRPIQASDKSNDHCEPVEYLPDLDQMLRTMSSADMQELCTSAGNLLDDDLMMLDHPTANMATTTTTTTEQEG